jgi:hypothetical protein
MEERRLGILPTFQSSGVFRKVVSLVLTFLFAASSPISMAVAFAETGPVAPTADQDQASSETPAPKSTDKPEAPLGPGDIAMQSVIQAVNAQNAVGNTAPSTSATLASENHVVSTDKKTTNSQPSGAGSGPIATPFVGGDTPPHLEREAIISQVKPDQTGALNYDIPIVVPPGRTKATTPDLSLVYSSRNGEDISPFGYGWSVNIPYIERENKLGTNNLYSRADFYSSLDGEIWGATTSPTTPGEGGGPTAFSIIAGGGGDGSTKLKPPILRKTAIAKGLTVSAKSSATTTLRQPTELTDARTANSKTFLTGWAPDGSPQYSAHIYANNIHYTDPATGQLADIDTTLIATSSGWAMDKAAYHARIPTTLSSNFLTFTNGDQQLTLGLATPRKVAAIGKKSSSGLTKNKEVTYSSALATGIDLDVLVDTDKVVKDAVISKLSALGNLTNKQFYEIPFKLTGNHPLHVTLAGQNLTQDQPITSDAEATITDASTTAVTYLWPPSAEDASAKTNLQHHIGISIRYELQADGSVLLTKLIPATWLERATYPVTADVTLSLYAGAGDGTLGKVCATWSSCHDASVSDGSANYTGTDASVEVDKAQAGGSQYGLSHNWYPIDTSSIPASASISSANLNLFAENINNSSGGLDLYVVAGTQAATSSLSTSDFPNLGTTAWSSAVSGSSLTNNAYNAFALNSTGIAALNLSGWTKFALREKNDFDNSAPTETSIVALAAYTSEQTGTSQDPYLDVTYTLPGTSGRTIYAPRFDNGDFRTYTYLVPDASSSDWVVQDKYGTTYTFGSATSSRLDNPSDSSQVYRWMLSEIRDTNGNYIKYNYNKDNGQVYPSSLLYTGNGSTDGPFQVNFLRTSRTDVATSSKTGFNVVDNYLVNEINATVNGTWVHKYTLSYGTGSNGRRSLLNSVTESGQQEDGSVSLSLPAQTFAYTASTSGWTLNTGLTHPTNSNGYFEIGNADNGARLVDMNGDGYPDVTFHTNNGGTDPHGTFEGGPAGIPNNYATYPYSPPGIIANSPAIENGVRFADVNGDGKIDVLSGTSVFFNNPSTASGFDVSASSTWTLPVAVNDGSGGDNSTRIVDLNGDGLADIINNTNAWINTGKGWASSTAWVTPVAFNPAFLG